MTGTDPTRDSRAINTNIALIVDLFQKAHVSIWACDADGSIILWSPGAAALYQLSEQQVRGKPYWELFVDVHERYAAIEDNVKVIDHGKPFLNQLAFDRSEDGKQRHMLTNCFRITDPETGENFLAEIGVEISDLALKQNEHRTLREVGVERVAMEQHGFKVRIADVNDRIREDLQEGRDEFRIQRMEWRKFIRRAGATDADRDFGQERLSGLEDAWNEAQHFLRELQRGVASCTCIEDLETLEAKLDSVDVLSHLDNWSRDA